jgi:hypothetical protein
LSPGGFQSAQHFWKLPFGAMLKKEIMRPGFQPFFIGGV